MKCRNNPYTVPATNLKFFLFLRLAAGNLYEVFRWDLKIKILALGHIYSISGVIWESKIQEQILKIKER
jgi:hypothetical protein